MIKKIFVNLLLSLVLALGLTACGGQEVEESSATQKEQVQESKQEQSENVTPKEEEESKREEKPKVDLTGNYKFVDSVTVDEYDYAENVLTFVGNNEVIKIKGYLCYDLYNGAGIAYTKYGPDGLEGIIGKDGKELVPVGKYDSLERVGTYQVFNYVKARDVKTQKFGVISVLGEEVVPFQYDEIQIRESFIKAKVGFCSYACKRGELYDFYTVDGKVLAEDVSSPNYSISRKTDAKGNVLLALYISSDIEELWIVEGKEGFLEKPHDYAEGWVHCGDRVFSYVNTSGEKKYICYSDDWQTTIPVDFLEESEITRIGDLWFADRDYYGACLYDMEGNIVKKTNFKTDVITGFGEEAAYINEGITFFSSKPATLYNDKFEEVLEVSDSRKFLPAGGMMYAMPLEGATEPNDLYDLKGNLVFKNVKLETYNAEEVRFFTEDGIFGFKSKDMPEVVLAAEGETYNNSDTIFSTWFCFVNEAGQYIFRDKNFNHIATFDGSTTYYPSLELFRYNSSYYNMQGELVYTEK